MIYCDCCSLTKNNTTRDNRWSREQISETYRKIIQGSFSSTIRIIYRYLPLMRKSMMPLFPPLPPCVSDLHLLLHIVLKLNNKVEDLVYSLWAFWLIWTHRYLHPKFIFVRLWVFWIHSHRNLKCVTYILFNNVGLIKRHNYV